MKMNSCLTFLKKWFAFLAIVLFISTELNAQQTASVVAEKVDKAIDEVLRKKKLKHAPPASDDELLRRLRIDITGTVPDIQESMRFSSDDSKGKVETKIDELISSPDYAENWSAIWSNLLVGRKTTGNQVYKSALDAWLQKSFESNVRYDKMTYQILSASGLNSSSGATNFILRYDADPLQLAAKTSSLFLGTSIKCAQCHNHPYEPFKQTDFYGLAAYFAKTHRETGAKMARNNMDVLSEEDKKLLREAKQIYDDFRKLREQKKKDGKDIGLKDLKSFKDSLDAAYGKKIELKRPTFIVDNAQGDVAIEKQDSLGRITKTVIVPHFLGSDTLKTDADGINRREVLAGLITSPQNPFFAKALVNRYWFHFLGKGFLETLDGFKPGYETDYDKALSILADDFVKNNYDLKRLVSVIARTKAYQRSSAVSKEEREKGNADFAFQRVRGLSSEELFRALVKTLDLKNQMGEKMNAEQYEKFKDGFFRKFLTVFGNDEMEEVEDFNGTIPQSLMMQYSTITKPLFAPNGVVAKIVSLAPENPDEQITRLYFQFLSRRPTAAELELMKNYLEKNKPTVTAVLDKAANKKTNGNLDAQENIAWVLLNSTEFITNH
jgi:hypothetical protein